MEFQAFDSVDEMFTAMHDAEEAANARATAAQKQITWGDYFVNPQHQQDGFLIFGEIYTLEHAEQKERELGASEEEIRQSTVDLEERYARGYRYGRHYSTVVPEGELGSTHVSVMMRTTKEIFEVARSCGWMGMIAPSEDGAPMLIFEGPSAE